MAETTELCIEAFPFHTRQKHMHAAHMVFGVGLYRWGTGNSAKPIWFTMLADLRCLQASMCGFTTPPPLAPSPSPFFQGMNQGHVPCLFVLTGIVSLGSLPSLFTLWGWITLTKSSRGDGSMRPDGAPWNPNRELSAQKTPLAQQVKGSGKMSYLLLSTIFPSFKSLCTMFFYNGKNSVRLQHIPEDVGYTLESTQPDSHYSSILQKNAMHQTTLT